jgi:hypothetical protein
MFSFNEVKSGGSRPSWDRVGNGRSVVPDDGGKTISETSDTNSILTRLTAREDFIVSSRRDSLELHNRPLVINSFDPSILLNQFTSQYVFYNQNVFK